MPSDVKCGLLVGIAVVLAVALLFFRREEPRPLDKPVQSAAPLASPQGAAKSLLSAEPVSRKKSN